MTWQTLAFISSLAAWGSFLGVVMIQGRVFLGFTVMFFFNLAVMSNSSLLLGLAFGQDLSWLSQSRKVAMVIHGGGLVCFSLGMWAAMVAQPFRRKNFLSPASCLAQNDSLIWLFWAGALAALITPLVSRIPTVSAIQSQIEPLTGIVLLIFFYRGVKSPTVLLLVLVWLVMTILQMIRSGHIGVVILAVQLAVVACFGQALSWRKIWLLMLCGFILFSVIFSWFSVRKGIRVEGVLKNLSFAEKIPTFFAHIKWVTPLNADYSSLYDLWESRFDMSQVYADQYDWMPAQQDYAGWSTVFPASLAAIVPRALWPQKPVIQGGTEFVNRFSGGHWNPASVQFNMPFPFEFFAMFGVRGLFLGMFILGYLINWAERAVCLRLSSLPITLALLAFVCTLAQGGDQIRLRMMVLFASVPLCYGVGRLIEYKASLTRQPRLVKALNSGEITGGVV